MTVVGWPLTEHGAVDAEKPFETQGARDVLLSRIATLLERLLWMTAVLWKQLWNHCARVQRSQSLTIRACLQLKPVLPRS